MELSLPVEKITSKQFLALAQYFSSEESILLHSGEGHSLSRYSYLGLFPTETLRVHQGMKNPWESMKDRMGSFPDAAEKIPLWMGFLGYPMGECSDWEKHISMHATKFPIAYFQKYQFLFVFEAGSGKLRAYGDQEHMEWPWQKKFTSGLFWQTLFASTCFKEQSCKMNKLSMGEEKTAYIKKVREIQDFLTKGDIYQLNYSHPFIFQGKTPPFAIFQKINAKNPAPYSAYVKAKNFSVVCSSPELFLQRSGRILETRPIKGTMPRGKTKIEDRKNQKVLSASKKDRAELTMITDLLRNDLGKFSEVGSVKVIDPFKIEAYENVFHMLSIIRSKVVSQKHPLDILRACFPGGSITGCPKLRAMELIHYFENASRDIYTGSIGVFFANGDFTFNIAIRTLLFYQDIITLRLGGAIVADSKPEKEYEETLHKGKTFFQILA